MYDDIEIAKMYYYINLLIWQINIENIKKKCSINIDLMYLY